MNYVNFDNGLFPWTSFLRRFQMPRLFLALHTDRDPSSDLPSPRLIQAELVESGHLPAELSQKLAQVRDLTAPPAEYSKSEAGEEAVPLSTQTGATLLETVRALVDLVKEQTAKAAL
jgi:hypothetical protein